MNPAREDSFIDDAKAVMDNPNQPAASHPSASRKFAEPQAHTPMSGHIARFWQLLANEHVRILIDIRRDHDEGQPPHWDSASFPNDVAKALAADRAAAPDMLAALQRVSDDDFESDDVLAIVRAAIAKATGAA